MGGLEGFKLEFAGGALVPLVDCVKVGARGLVKGLKAAERVVTVVELEFVTLTVCEAAKVDWAL